MSKVIFDIDDKEPLAEEQEVPKPKRKYKKKKKLK